MERVMIFIDGANLFFSAIDLSIKPNFDYLKFVQKLVGPERKLMRVYYYDAHIDQRVDPERYKRQQKFLLGMNRLSYFEFRKGRMLNGRQKGVDVRIAVDMVTYGFKNNYDIAIIVSADSDLVPAVENIKAEGKQVELAFFDKCWELKNSCDTF
ncbi:MAG: NYN domain-containing protein [candidate division Zixibacteria bacterium]|nr:NYN domain-containing protein [candidate division Zixibacteria bacterium]